MKSRTGTANSDLRTPSHRHIPHKCIGSARRKTEKRVYDLPLRSAFRIFSYLCSRKYSFIH